MPQEPAFFSRDLLLFAHTLADLSGKAILPYFRAPLDVIDKGGSAGFDPVTEADTAAERVIRQALAESYPDHAIIGEEFGASGGHAGGGAPEYQWIIDPIDGTRAFIMGFPLWGTLIGLLHNGKPVLGLMDQPFAGERFWSEAATSRLRTPRGEQAMRTRACPRLGDAIFATTHPDLFTQSPDVAGFARLKAGARMTRYGGDCYLYAMLAAGHIDVVAEVGLKPHDIVALVPIIERAGGSITSWDGGAPDAGGRILACGDQRLHEQALRLLAG